MTALRQSIKLSVKLILFVIVSVDALQMSSSWRADDKLKDLITDRCILDTIYGKSLINCANKCFNNDLCLSFFYIKHSLTCNHYSTKFENVSAMNSTVFIKRTGSAYYFSTEKMSKNISKPCATAKCTDFTYLPSVNAYFKLAPISTNDRQNASEQCIIGGGSLASPKTQRTIDAIERMIHGDMGGLALSKGFWLSAVYSQDVGNFVWPDDNSTVLSRLWHPGKPEYFKRNGINTECVVLVPLYQFKLADYHCNSSGDSIIPLCECY